MNIFKETCWRTAIRSIVDTRRQENPDANYQAIAEATRIPKSYLSKALAGQARLNADQMYQIARYLQLADREQDYLQLLLAYDRSGLEVRRKELMKKIRTLQDEAHDTRHHLQAGRQEILAEIRDRYYLNPMHQIIHIALSVPAFQNDLAGLAAGLRVELQEVQHVVNQLEQLGIIERTERGIRTVVKSIHLPKDSPVFQAWKSQLRSRCNERLLTRPGQDDYSFSVCFSACEETGRHIQRSFLALIKDAEERSRGTRAERVFQLNFDLFAWLHA